MEEDRISIIVSSRNENNEQEKFVEHVHKTCGCHLSIHFLINKIGVSLTKIYSDVLKETTTDIVVFMHDDIEFLKPDWGKELIRLFKEHNDYGIIGVAGSAYFDEQAAWWRYKDIYGQVAHRKGDNIWLTSFSKLLDKDLEEVVVIDGLFIAVDKTRITQDYDDSIEGFNFYDIDFCLANFLDNKIKIGVTTNIRLLHNSVGELHEEWHRNKDKVNEKYKSNYPIKVKK